MARKSIICSTADGGLGLKDFRLLGQASRPAALVSIIEDRCCKAFFLLKYFCGSQLATLRPEWRVLRENLTPSAPQPTQLYSRLLELFRSFSSLNSFTFSTRAFYSLLVRKFSTVPILPRQWASFVLRQFSLVTHWSLVRDSLSENSKNDLAWLITMRAVKVRHSLRNWGYIDSAQCASCRRVETIDHCFLNCKRVKPVWAYFLPLLSALLPLPFSANCAFVFFYQFSAPGKKNQRLLLYIIKTILYGIWVFRNKATFRNGKHPSKAIIKHIFADIRKRILTDKHRFSPTMFRSLWTHPALCDSRADDNLVFLFRSD